MVNQTYIEEFHLWLFSANSDYTSLTISVFFLLYIFGVIINCIAITVIYIDDQLHNPMYLFLCNLAFVDICYTNTTVPNLLHMLLSGDNTVSFAQCFTQLYFYVFVVITEDVLIFIMAYDRYVAICDPLHYHYILSTKNCLLIAISNWTLGCLNSLVLTIPLSYISYCQSHRIHQFYCDPKALINISCAGGEKFYIIIYMELFVFGVFPLMFCVTSYVKIIRVILRMKSMEGRKRAFSTCSSHLTVVIAYCVTGASAYLMPQSEYSNVLDPIFTVQYAVITPMMNPIIYSLRNKDMKSAWIRLLKVNGRIRQ